MCERAAQKETPQKEMHVRLCARKAIQRTVGARLPCRGCPAGGRTRRLTSAIALRVLGKAPHHGLHCLPQHRRAARGAGGQGQPGGPGQEQGRRGRCGGRGGRRGAHCGRGGGSRSPGHSGAQRSQGAPPVGAHSRLQTLRSHRLHPCRPGSRGPSLPAWRANGPTPRPASARD